jgi:phosphoribosylformylglycinamidine (FGAM) synthase PurS component
VTAVRAFEVSLVIPDNEALTALATLRRLGIHVSDVRRADLWRFTVDAAAPGDDLPEALRRMETIFNPNKHRLRERTGAEPDRGEAWIGEAADGNADSTRVAGRSLPGVLGVERFVAWRLLGADGEAADSGVVDRAVETLLCNRAFQRTIR